MPIKKLAYFSPGRTLLLAMSLAIAIGTLLLLLPICQATPMSFIDILFTATSTTTVCGLMTVPISNFTPIGKVILMILMQIGGLGLVTMSLFLITLFIDIGMATQLMAGQLMEITTWQHIKKILKFIVLTTIFFELIGGLIFFGILKADMPTDKALMLGLFHAISSFCNAGFSLFKDGMITYNKNYTMMLTTIGLMLAGGLGFLTLSELVQYGQSILHRKRVRNISLHTKLVLYTTAGLIITGFVLIWLLERHNTLQGFSPLTGVLNAFFTTIASRSTGFASINVNDMQIATLFLTLLICFIGSSPGSTGSGIKTTVFAIFLATVKTAAIGRTSVQLLGRRIARDQVFKALSVIAISLGWVALTVFCLLITETEWNFFDIFFEAISAFSVLGISTGLTPYLSIIGKYFIILSMIVGRVGSLTLIIALHKPRKETIDLEYPEERLMLS